MTYYSGDYSGLTRAGRMAGDPGFFSFLGGLAKKAAGFIPGAGPVVSGVLEGVTAHGAKSAMQKAGRGAITIVKKHPGMTAAAGAGVLAGGAGAMMLGRHPGLRGGRRHKRMRVTNPKALRRAIRRTQGFAKLAMRTIHLVHPRKKARFGGFRKRTRKAA
jgi:hypothetical protein